MFIRACLYQAVKKLLELIRQQQHVNVKNYEIVTLHFLVSKL